MDELFTAFKEKNIILFVGAGVSMNLGIPSWSELIDIISNSLGYDSEIYKTFGDSLALAEYYKLEKSGLGELSTWMDEKWHSTDIKIEESEIHRIIANAGFPLIYTTNFDRWIENAFEYYRNPFKKIVNVSHLKNIDSKDTQIIKFHGDLDDESSIVLDESSYFKRLEFETPLDIKLRSDVLGKTVLFIGYSLSDINIRLLFYKLSKMWKENNQVVIQPQSYVFSAKPNPIQKRILDEWGINMISSEIDDPKEALIDFMKNLTKQP